MGYTLEAHPTVADSSNHPDYLVFERKEPVFYLEATVAGLPSQQEAGAEARLGEVLDLVNGLDSPNFLLEVQYRGLPSTPPPVRELVPGLEGWLRSLNFNAIEEAWKDNDFDSLPRFEWSHDGLILSFVPIPRASGSTSARPIAITMGEAHWVTTDKDIRSAVERKASKYGELSLPMVIAVNFVGDHCDDIDIGNALFGSEAIQVVPRPDGSHELGPGRRLPNGVWFGKDGPRKRNVSAVLIGDRVNTYTAGATTPLLVHNPYAENPLALSAYPLVRSVPDHATRSMQKIEGRNASEFLRLPSPWPPLHD